MKFDDVVFFSPGSVIRRSVSILALEMPIFLTISALAFSPSIVMMVIAGQPGGSIGGQLLGVFSYIIFRICQPLATAMLTHGVFRRLRGEQASIRESLQTGLSRFLPVVVFSLLSTLIISLGYLLCSIPGIVFSCMLYAGMPSVVAEGKGSIEAIRRSNSLTKEFRWPILGLLITIWVTSTMMSGVVLSVVSSFDAPLISLLELIGTYLTQVLTAALSGVLTAVTYHDLRDSRDGIDSGDLISVFN